MATQLLVRAAGYLAVAQLSFVFYPFAQTDQDRTTPDGLIAAIDHYAEKTWEHGKAISLLHEALSVYPDNDELLWRLSRSYADSAEVLEKRNGPEETILAMYETALFYAERAIDANPHNSMAYTYRAIATGQMALYKGIWSAIDLVKQTREAVEKALELDDTNDIAHFVYARTHAEVSQRPRLFRRPLGLGWANVETALRHFDIAVELNPDFILYRLDAARIFVREGEYDRARELLRVVPNIADQHQFDYIYRNEALELYERIAKR